MGINSTAFKYSDDSQNLLQIVQVPMTFTIGCDFSTCQFGKDMPSTLGLWSA